MGKFFDDETGKLRPGMNLRDVQLGPVIHGGYSPAVGGYVESERDFNEQLKRQSDEMSARMGFDVDYQPADRADPKGHGATSIGDYDERKAEILNTPAAAAPE